MRSKQTALQTSVSFISSLSSEKLSSLFSMQLPCHATVSDKSFIPKPSVDFSAVHEWKTRLKRGHYSGKVLPPYGSTRQTSSDFSDGMCGRSRVRAAGPQGRH